MSTSSSERSSAYYFEELHKSLNFLSFIPLLVHCHFTPGFYEILLTLPDSISTELDILEKSNFC